MQLHVIDLGPVVLKVNSAVQGVVIFSTAAEKHKSNAKRDIEPARDKIILTRKCGLTFNTGFTS